MKDFENKIPDDYYGSNVVNSFNEIDINSIDFSSSIYHRNPVKKYKLSLNHMEVIEFFVRLLRPKNFIELGTQFGKTTKRIIPLIPGDYYGVDISKQDNLKLLNNKYKNMKFFEQSTDDFFSNDIGDIKFDMGFIDAGHSYEQVYKDFLSLKDYINKDGIIFFHDTYPANIENTAPNLSGDCYRVPEKIRLEHNKEFEIITFPVNPGMSMARKVKKHIGNEK
jgi:predicted O-methyltransferase YrrM